MALKKQKSLRRAISREKENLASLEQKRLESQERLAALKAELTAMHTPGPSGSLRFAQSHSN